MRFDRRRATISLLVGLPLLSLALMCVAWLRHGLDLPFFDDWRGYINGEIQSLSPAYLFRPVNDTISPVGFALDAIAQRVLDGNSVAYQLASMLAVLGALLALQWALLARALQDRLLAAIAFLFTLPMLQPGSYWGRENLAYHQALPLVFLLAALWAGLHERWGERRRAAAAFLLGLLAGMTYISGAFGTLGLAAALLLVAALAPALPARRPVLVLGLALAAAGLATATIQFVRAVLPVMGQGHRPGAPMAWPTEVEYWVFYFGKIGRALLLPRDWPWLALLLVLLACAAIAWVAVRTVRRGRAGTLDARDAQVGVVLTGLAGLVAVYMLLVAAGRTHLRPDDVKSLSEIFAFAFQRFHFFWATLLWPWLVAAGLLAWQRWRAARPAARPAWPVALPVAASVAWMAGQGAFAHERQFAVDESYRKPTVACLQEQLRRAGKIECEEFNLDDFRGAYLHARRIGASFVRYFPIPAPQLGEDVPWPWFRFTRDDATRKHTERITPGTRLASRAGDDAQYHFHVADPASTAACVVMDVNLRIRVERRDIVKVYWRPLGAAEASEEFAEWRILEPGRPNLVHIRLESDRGFENVVRLDPVSLPQEFVLEEAEFRCPLRDTRFTGRGLYSIRTGFLALERQRIRRTPGKSDWYRAEDDPQLRIHVVDREAMAQCGKLEVEVELRAARPDLFQVFHRPPGANGFNEQVSVKRPLAGGGVLEKFSVEVVSPQGLDAMLRIDPVQQAQDVQIKELVFTCRHRIAPRH